jgi:hypothetical protein
VPKNKTQELAELDRIHRDGLLGNFKARLTKLGDCDQNDAQPGVLTLSVGFELCGAYFFRCANLPSKCLDHQIGDC